MGDLMTAPSCELGDVPDYSRRAGLCVEVLGWLTLLRLDLLGLVLIKAGRGVRARDRRWWKVAVAIWALHLAVWVVIGAVAATIGGSIRIFGRIWTIPLGPWMIFAFGLIGLALAVPFFWLLAPATRLAMAESQSRKDAEAQRTEN